MEDDLDFDVTFMQWVTTDISNLITQTLSADNFVSFYVKNLIQLQHIHSKKQSQYLKKLKEELLQDEVIVLVDFAEIHIF